MQCARCGTATSLLFALIGILPSACSGTIGEGGTTGGPGMGGGNSGPAGPGSPGGGRGGGGGGSTPGGPNMPGGGGGGAQPSACMGQPAQAPVLHARMLSPRQYNNTVEDLLKVGGNPARDFGGGADTQLDDLGAERRANAADLVASQAVAQLAMWSPCAATAPDCKQQIIDTIGMRAFRHPLSAGGAPAADGAVRRRREGEGLRHRGRVVPDRPAAVARLPVSVRPPGGRREGRQHSIAVGLRDGQPPVLLRVGLDARRRAVRRRRATPAN